MGKQGGGGGGGLTPAKAYLTLYNLAQFGLWAAILVLTARQLLAGGIAKGISKPSQAAVDGVWPAVGPLVKLAVGGAWMELVHTLMGLSRGGASSAFWQCFGRWFNVFALQAAFDTPKHSIWLPSLYLAWAAIEIIRYPFYVVSDFAPAGEGPPRWLVWLRYSAFIPLYPWGMASEIALLYISLSEVKQAVAATRKFCLPLPGAPQYSLFNFHYFIVFGLAVLYPLAGPLLYTYMFKQRTKRLGGGGGKAKAAGAASAFAAAGGGRKSRKAD